MRQLIDAFVEPALWFAADWSLRWAALLIAVTLMLWIFRPRRAVIRQSILLAALAAGLLVLFAPRWGSGWQWSFSFPGGAWELTDREAPPRTPPPPLSPPPTSLARSSRPGKRVIPGKPGVAEVSYSSKIPSVSSSVFFFSQASKAHLARTLMD